MILPPRLVVTAIATAIQAVAVVVIVVRLLHLLLVLIQIVIPHLGAVTAVTLSLMIAEAGAVVEVEREVEVEKEAEGEEDHPLIQDLDQDPGQNLQLRKEIVEREGQGLLLLHDHHHLLAKDLDSSGKNNPENLIYLTPNKFRDDASL